MARSTARPPRLAELQSALVDVWTRPEGIAAALASRAGRVASPWILGTAGAGAADRLAVYSDAYFSRLLESLGADFPAAKRVLGEEAFRVLIAGYLFAHPSDSYNISDVGEGLRAFAADHELARRHPYLADLCALEWSVLRALFTDRMPDADPARLAAVAPEAWEHARLTLDPTLALLESGWPVHELWDARFEPGPAAPPPPAARAWIAVWRDSEWVRVRALDARAWKLLRSLARGATLGRACAQADAGPEAIQQWFATWLSEGLVKGLIEL